MAWTPGPGGRPRACCPRCGSLERHRFLAFLVQALAEELGRGPVLDVGPSAALALHLKHLSLDRYIAMDRDPGADRRRADVIGDITSLPFASGSISTVVCYHVLEHVPEDRTAIAELARVLSPAGLALIQVPCRFDRPTEEDPDAPEEERVRRFGQADHVRYYGGDFEDRLRAEGLMLQRVSPRDFLPDDVIELGRMVADEVVWLGTKEAADGYKDRIGKRATFALAALWQAGAATQRGELARVRGQLESARSSTAAAQARAEKSEEKYRRLRSRWPVRVMGSMAAWGRSVTGRGNGRRSEKQRA
ncbi:MAG TPA: class I SAM-dependent methyltransferase [Acidimicrobiia bacterium]